MSLSRQVLLLNRQLLAYYKKELEATGTEISLVDMLFLSFLYVHEGCRQDDMVKAFNWDKAHVTRHLQQMEQKGWLTRSVHAKDKRAKVVLTTPAGKSYEPLIRGIQKRWNAEVFDGNEAEAKQLEAQLQQLLERAKCLVSDQDSSPCE